MRSAAGAFVVDVKSWASQMNLPSSSQSIHLCVVVQTLQPTRISCLPHTRQDAERFSSKLFKKKCVLISSFCLFLKKKKICPCFENRFSGLLVIYANPNCWRKRKEKKRWRVLNKGMCIRCDHFKGFLFEFNLKKDKFHSLFVVVVSIVCTVVGRFISVGFNRNAGGINTNLTWWPGPTSWCYLLQYHPRYTMTDCGYL